MSQVFDDLYNQVQALQDQADQNQPVVDGLSTQQQPDGSVRAQLDFPLDEQSTQEILQCFQYGSVTLVAGTATVNNIFLGLSSTIIFSLVSTGGTPGTVTLSQAAGSFTLNSTSATDTSTFNWFAVP